MQSAPYLRTKFVCSDLVLYRASHTEKRVIRFARVHVCSDLAKHDFALILSRSAHMHERMCFDLVI